MAWQVYSLYEPVPLSAKRGSWKALLIGLMSALALALLCMVKLLPPLNHEATVIKSPLVHLPKRAPNALAGSKVLASTIHLSAHDRETVFLREVKKGNVPSFLRKLTPLTFRQELADHQVYEVTLFVSNDYLAVGSDHDYVRIPINLPSALAVVASLKLNLPTKKIVDLIVEHSTVRLEPRPMRAGRMMSSSRYILDHNRLITQQMGLQTASSGTISGHKKDLIFSSRLVQKQGRVAIYGWHTLSGQPIQPVSTVHRADYADYSHGLRLVSSRVLVNGKEMSMAEVLAHPRLASLLSDEGPLPGKGMAAAGLARN